MLAILDVDPSQLGVEDGLLVLVAAEAGLLEFGLRGRVHRRGHAFAEVDFLVDVRPRVLSGPEPVLENLHAALKEVVENTFLSKVRWWVVVRAPSSPPRS